MYLRPIAFIDTPIGFDGFDQRLPAFLFVRERNERVFDFLQRREDRRAVREERFFLRGFLHSDVGSNSSRVEERPADGWAE